MEQVLVQLSRNFRSKFKSTLHKDWRWGARCIADYETGWNGISSFANITAIRGRCDRTFVCDQGAKLQAEAAQQREREADLCDEGIIHLCDTIQS